MEEKWVLVKREHSSPDTDFLDFDLTTIIMPIAIIVGIVAVLMPMAQQMQAQTQILQAQAYHGTEDPRTLHATNQLNWINLIYDYPFRPWIAVFLINDGPSPVEIGINYPDDRFTMNPGETVTINRTGAMDEKINIIFFKSFPGLKASVRATGTF